MAVDPKQADAYVRDLLQKFDKEPAALDPVHRRIIHKFKEAQGKGDRIYQELEQMRNQVKQAEARVRSLELQIADAQGKASSFLDLIVSMKFEDEPKVEAKAEKPVEPQKTEAPPVVDSKKKLRPLTKAAAA